MMSKPKKQTRANQRQHASPVDSKLNTTMLNRQSNNSRSKLTGVMPFFILIPLLCNCQITRIPVPFPRCLLSLILITTTSRITSTISTGPSLTLHQSSIGYHIDQVLKQKKSLKKVNMKQLIIA